MERGFKEGSKVRNEIYARGLVGKLIIPESERSVLRVITV